MDDGESEQLQSADPPVDNQLCSFFLFLIQRGNLQSRNNGEMYGLLPANTRNN